MTGRGALIILSGLPGTGKTYFAHALAETVPFRHIESDAIRRGLFVSPRYTSWESAQVFDEVERLARGALTAGEVALIDATNLTHGDRRRFFTLARQADTKVVSVRVVAPEAVVRERLAGPRKGYSQADAQVYERFRERTEPFKTPLVVVDTRFPPGPSLRLVAHLLGD